jgi:multiple sugar transport system substrate-binding protein
MRKVLFYLLLLGLTTLGASQDDRPDRLTIAALAGNESLGLKAVAPRWEEETRVELEIVEFPYNSLFERLVTTFQANTPTFDLVMLDDPWMPAFGTGDWLVPLDQTFGLERDPDIPDITYEVGTWPPPRGPAPPSEVGKEPALLGLTIVGNVEMFAYRSDLMEEPQTWEDVLAAAQEHYQPGEMAGYVIRGLRGNPIVADFLPVLWSFGGDVFDDQWQVVIDSPESIGAVRFLVQELKAVAQEGPQNTDAADRSRLLAIGEGLQSTIWPGEITGIVLNPEVTQVGDQMAFAPIPAGPSGEGTPMMGNWLLAIPKASRKQETAFEFIQWITSPDVQREYVSAGGIPSRLSLLNDPELNEANPYFEALAESLQAPPNWRPRTDQWPAVEAIMGTRLNEALVGSITPEEAVSRMAEEIRATMEQAGYY